MGLLLFGMPTSLARRTAGPNRTLGQFPVPCPSPAPALLPPAGEGARRADAGAFCRKVKSCPHPNPLPLAGEGEERWEERASAAAVNVFQPNNVVLAQVPTRLHLDQLHRLRAAV